LYKEFVLVSFDPIEAQTLRLPVRGLDNVLLVLIAVTIVVALQTVGVALMVAMLITPAATALLVTQRLTWAMALGAAFGAAAGVSGLFVSYYARVASGAAIVLAATLLFAVVFLVAPRGARMRRDR
jgi:ABC-type Mn2+/Zn2+ transport system permease subunit